ncbi:hypothetical protein IBL26_09655 [Roseomonas aerophila]|uniref:Uncharacterized protein n=1 Tax=Teichococcus aerophilus TaxID=1224513 RepID=A0ABR7RLW2_9PROT|nr:hypothetical protein [Pseudoroseomonas aerophila]MBC9207097.1 hypothetical protein [Pseudoroseomonas aerophila]
MTRVMKPAPAPTEEEKREDLEFTMQRGDLLVVRYLADRHGMAECERLFPDGTLSAWLARAEAHEAEHGEGAFLDPSHRFNRELLPILDRQAAGEHMTPKDLPAPRWNMDRGWHHD